MATRFIYSLSEYAQAEKKVGKDGVKSLLGGKGVNLSEITASGAPVPKGFVITSDACREFFKSDPPAIPEGVWTQITEAILNLEEECERKLGTGDRPLVLAVRNSPEVSYNKTLLSFFNVGFTDPVAEALISATENPKFVWTTFLRYIQLYATQILKIDPEKLNESISAIKAARNIASEYDLEPGDIENLCRSLKGILETDEIPFPQEPLDQLKAVIESVLLSWKSEQAEEFRTNNKLEGQTGSAIIIQQMVFGNLGEGSGVGFYFTRNPGSGENVMSGNYVVGCQGTEYIAKLKQPQPISSIDANIPSASDRLIDANRKIERHFKDIQKVDFTAEVGDVYILQTKPSRRSPIASVKILVDLVSDGVITKEEAVTRVLPSEIDQVINSLFRQEDLNQAKEKKCLIAHGTSSGLGAFCGPILLDGCTG
jgi:pyruvate,orthophosphate dikinase